MLIEERPFKAFELYCSECNDVMVQLSDLTESPFKNEVLVLYQIHSHTKETGHHSFDGNIEPLGSIQHIDTTIEVNDV